MNTLRLSTRLVLIASRYLARAYYDNKRVTAPELAQHYNVNVRALMPALRGLVRAGILQSHVGGRTPGFIFASDPSQIMVSDVIDALEDKLSAPCCKELVPGLKCDCGSSAQCKLHSLFDDLVEEVHLRYSRISIASYAG